MKILKPLLYFSIFNHPLKEEEVYLYSPHKELKFVVEELEIALSKGIIEKTEDFYHTHLSRESIEKRKKGNINAEIALLKAKKRAKFITRFFPFIEGIAISGSLSKGYFDENSDVDYFIITKPNHLWTCRTFLVLFKKIFLFNSRKYFCMNYFISSEYLEIEEKNIFTATEIATLIPLYGDKIFQAFFEKNKWYQNFIPNKKISTKNLIPFRKSKMIQFSEYFYSGLFGKIIEKTSFSLTLYFWKIKFRKKMTSEDFALAFKSSKKVSKHHPSNFQKKIIDAINLKYDFVKENFQIDIPKEHV
ncbi:nucleotidyltransferase domain-containing protein [Flavobacterium jejuense]|uniref:Nucleotidyltransferase domain-containing protein n=1 Tax=Flavobacterium jejuense TaxID=1544455 RepID=A0ABX0IY20_9FLAO|nr:nucleotidyltransferase domain-containing protein [Flavobacterium jejuense]NHN27448.1 nucleotidyltransferase domain-containing protein [Flavobacterium jejuense]